jgi:serine phosphatase RsbU (regulator of sigma subunit)
MLVTQVTGVASAIRQYAIDMLAKEEIDCEIFLSFREKLKNHGLEITYFEVIKNFVNDFLIKIGVRNISSEDLNGQIKSIGNIVFKTNISVIYENIIDDVSYFQIIPEIKLDIIYGTGAITSEGNKICGDNFIVKDLKNGKFISAISDGMGNGYSAFQESNTTLNLINDIVKLNLNSSTSLEVLNTFYSIQEYLEQYATLDLVEINRYTKEAKFYKLGGTTTYIVKKNGKIEKIVNQNLPFGIGENIENFNYYLENDDLILMSSDGIFENIIEEQLLEDFIQTIKQEAPQKIVYEILNYAMNQKQKTTDDMTLIALKIKYV